MRLRLAIGFLALAIAPAMAQSAPPPGATACTGCHPPAATSGIAVPPLNGRPAAEIVSQMAAFSSATPSTVMGRIAKGFSETEVQAIAAWYAAQK